MINEISKRLISSLVLIPVSLFFIFKGSYYFNFFLITFFLISSYEWFKLAKNKFLLSLGLTFLLITTYSAYLIRGSTQNELLLFLFIILICVTTDIGGYLFGNMFKGPKLTNISPNKTYAGSIGGYLLAIISAYLFITKFTIFKNDLKFIITIILISTISQLGDLTISYFKRLYKKKNTGKLIPGHGGLLDRVDGIIFAIPFSFIIFEYLKI
tara:strand:- start:5714 stop:6349 length:636 start_codon:yes stop_codon:yes gene_type:complete